MGESDMSQLSEEALNARRQKLCDSIEKLIREDEDTSPEHKQPIIDLIFGALGEVFDLNNSLRQIANASRKAAIKDFVEGVGR